MSQTLISVVDAAALHGQPGVVFVDVRHQLTDPAYGARSFAEGHIAGAVFASLDNDLSDLSITGHGRHPMPSAERFAAALGRLGIAPGDRVIAYDDGDGAYAARLWFLLGLAGHAWCAVLDGGFAAWKAATLPIGRDAAPRPPTDQPLAYAADRIVGADEVLREVVELRRALLIDARGAPRFRGEVEPIDKVAGHVPGAVNRPYTTNLDAQGRFKPAAQLREEFAALIGDLPLDEVWLMCGSGVTACHNLLAMEHAGLHGARVFADSWSGWISDPARPVATGE